MRRPTTTNVANPAPAHPANKRTETGSVDPAMLRIMVSALCELQAAEGRPVRRKAARQIILGRLGALKTPDEILRFARNDLGVVDPTGIIAVNNVMRGAR